MFEDERFARPTRVERDPATGELTVLAEFITGSRLSDLLEATADAGIVPGVDVALGYLLDTLPALTLLHSTDGITHGLIDASRTVLTPDGQIVFLDPVFGSAVERLGLSRQRLWAKYGIASPAGDGLVHSRSRRRHRSGGPRRARARTRPEPPAQGVSRCYRRRSSWK